LLPQLLVQVGLGGPSVMVTVGLFFDASVVW
jgi:hypothetical protein